MIKHLNIKIFGQVHNVNFRYYTKQKAVELDLAGFVENRYQPELVYVEAEGEENALKEFTDWCRQGPLHADVLELVSKEGEIKNFSDFQIKR